MENYCLRGTEFQLGKMKNVLEIDGVDASITLNVLNPMNCILKNGQNGKSKCYVCFTTIKKEEKLQ